MCDGKSSPTRPQLITLKLTRKSDNVILYASRVAPSTEIHLFDEQQFRSEIEVEILAYLLNVALLTADIPCPIDSTIEYNTYDYKGTIEVTTL